MGRALGYAWRPFFNHVMPVLPKNYDWHPDYSVGIPALDAQHKRLLQLCQRISSCTIHPIPEGYDVLHYILRDMANYAEEHFRSEEQVLRDMHFPDLEKHLAEHRVYEAKLSEFLASLSAHHHEPEQLAKFLGSSWVGHILHSDMDYAAYYKSAAPCVSGS